MGCLKLTYYQQRPRMRFVWGKKRQKKSVQRFYTMDPHAENYYAWSPYAYVGNSPLKYTDPTGMDWFRDENGTVQYFEGETKSFDNWIHLSANKYDKSVVDAIGSDIMTAAEISLNAGWNKFISYFGNADLGQNYFQNSANINYDDNASGLMGVIATILPGIKMSIRISQMTHEWVDERGWSESKNAMEHHIGMFLVSDNYLPEYAGFIGGANEIRGLLVNDRQQGQMMDALKGVGNTAFEWRDLADNYEGIQKWRAYRNVPSPIQVFFMNRYIGFPIPLR